MSSIYRRGKAIVSRMNTDHIHRGGAEKNHNPGNDICVDSNIRNIDRQDFRRDESGETIKDVKIVTAGGEDIPSDERSEDEEETHNHNYGHHDEDVTEVSRLRKEVESLKQAVTDQGSLLLKLSKFVEWHDKEIYGECQSGKDFVERTKTIPIDDEPVASTSASSNLDEKFSHANNNYRNGYAASKANFEDKHSSRGIPVRSYSKGHHFDRPTFPGRVYRGGFCHSSQQRRREYYRQPFKKVDEDGREGNRQRGSYTHLGLRNHTREQSDQTHPRFKSSSKPRQHYYQRREFIPSTGNQRENLLQTKRMGNFKWKQFHDRRSEKPVEFNHPRNNFFSNIDTQKDEQNTSSEEDGLPECPFCGWKFGKREHLESHLKTHKLFTCFKCEEQFCIQESFRRHLEWDHSISREEVKSLLDSMK